MPNANTLTVEKRFMALFIGRSGSGKTVAECSFLSDDAITAKRMVKVLDFDGRIRGILNAPWLATLRDAGLIDYDYFPPKPQQGQKSTSERLNDFFEAMMVQYKQGQGPYETLVLDSLTSQTFALVCEAIPITHAGTKGKRLGTVNMTGPEDYGFEAQGTYQALAFLRTISIPNIIVSAHIVDRYGKLSDADGKINPYSESVPIGEKLSIRDKIGENVGIYFDHVFRFEKTMQGYEEHFTVQFHSDLARTAYPNLPNGKHDITGKNFYKELMRLTRATLFNQDDYHGTGTNLLDKREVVK